jgi:hypothetical protein
MIEIKTADQLADPGLEARRAARRSTPEAEVLRRVLREFVERPEPVSIGDILAALPHRSAEAARDSLARLDAESWRSESSATCSGRAKSFRIFPQSGDSPSNLLIA